MDIRAAGVAMATSVAIIVAGPMVVSSTPAAADRPKVEKAEYQKVKPGWKITRVHKLFGTKGRKVAQGDGLAIRVYDGWALCIRVDVTYRHTDEWRVESKKAWVDTDCVP
jgi:hypothetical protein